MISINILILQQAEGWFILEEAPTKQVDRSLEGLRKRVGELRYTCVEIRDSRREDMHAFFKPVMIIAVLFGLFAYVFFKSGTLEITQEDFMERGMPMKRTVFNTHWDRFGDYVKNTPERISKWFSDVK